MHQSMMALDFETVETGALQGQPWQLGMVDLQDGDVVPGSEAEYFFEIGQVERNQMPGRLREQSAIWSAQGRKESLTACWPLLKERLQHRILIAHNTATEKKVFAEALPMMKLGPWIDTLVLARSAYPALTSYRLEDLCDVLQLREELERRFPNRRAHDALWDAAACGLLACHILTQPGWNTLSMERLKTLRPTTYYTRNAQS